MNFADRLKKVRMDQHPKMTQEEFARSLDTTRACYKNYEYGLAVPSGPFIKLVCIKYGVNQQWLETGEGPQYLQQDGLYYAQEVRDLLQGKSPFRVAIMSALAAMPDDWWIMWERQLRDEMDAQKKDR